MKQMFNIPNLFTASNLMCGIISIILALSGRLEWACYFIYFAAIFDFFDGFLARKLKISSEMGKQLDSLADMVTFGVAPGILVFVIIVIQQEGGWSHSSIASFSEINHIRIKSFMSSLASGDIFKNEYYCLAGLIIPFFSLFRLAKFNIDTRQSESFIGLNTPANTIFFTAFPLILSSNYSSGNFEGFIFHLVQPMFLIPLTLVMSIMLITEIPFFALKFKDFSWKNNQIRFIFLGACAILIPTFLAWSIPIIIILYLLLSVIENQRKKTQHEI